MNTAHIEQQKARMAHMPWLYLSAKPHILEWARPWQAELHAQLAALEDVRIASTAFVAPSAHLFAEPQRAIVIGERSTIAAEAFLHGPITLGDDVSINPRASLDGGSAGITIGAGTRIATAVNIFAFDHGMAAGAPVRAQPTRSRGVLIGEDVWIGAGAGITDGVTIADRAIVGMGAVVTQDVPPGAKVAGVPARVIGQRD